MERFDEIYDKVNMATKETIKDARSKKRKFVFGTFLLLLVVTIIIYFAAENKIFAVMSAVMSVIAVMFVGLKGNSFYRETYKNEVIRNLIRTYDNKLYFDSKYGINVRDYKISKFDNSFNVYHSEDRIFGRFDDESEIQIAEVRTEETETYYNNGQKETNSYETFSGLYGIIKLKRNLLASIQVYNDSHGNRYHQDRIEIDSAAFEECYDLITKDKILALKIFTPELIEKFNELRNEHPKSRFELKIENEMIYFRFRCGHRLFEPPTFKADLDKKLLERYFKLIYYPIELSKMLVANINNVIE